MGSFFGNIEIKNIYFGQSEIKEITLGNQPVWSGKIRDFTGLTFTAAQASTVVRLTGYNDPSWIGYYSLNQEKWRPYTLNSSITLNVGDTLYFKGDIGSAFSESTHLQFWMSGSVAASGNLMSLWCGDSYATETTVPSDYAGYRLFEDCDALTTAPGLLATTLTAHCCEEMFSGCTGLTTTPTFTATTLAPYCYAGMFTGCTSITSATTLGATTVSDYGYYQMFNGCTSLATAPTLNASTVSSYGCSQMFNGCTSLHTPPALNATSLGTHCYHSMFQGSGLTSAPDLPATTLTDSCYYSMFKNCTGITTGPSINATALAANCFREMFYGCSILTTAPALPVTTLATYCYADMFHGCTHLALAPTLPATTLQVGCYDQMFYGCQALTAAPTLPAASLVASCYGNMFNGCTSLMTMTAKFESWLDGATSNWLNGAPAGGTFTCSANLEQPSTRSASTVPSNWTWDSFLGLRIKADAGNSVTMNFSSGLSAATWSGYLSTNGLDWTSFTGGTRTMSMPAGSSIYVKGTQGAAFSDQNYLRMYGSSGTYSLSGNIMSVWCGDSYKTATTIPYAYAGFYMFAGASNRLTSINGLTLPATTLKTGCYERMFEGCTSITTAPVLNAMNLASGCYKSMFSGCTSLTAAPNLPATTVYGNCYYSMFNGCTSLASVNVLPATTLANSCYRSMFAGCTSLRSVPTGMLPATNLANTCYYYMFEDCTVLTYAPDLPATTLMQYCYAYMFNGCSSLAHMKVSFTSWPGTSSSSTTYAATHEWVTGVSSAGVFECPTLLPLSRGTSYIPSTWTLSRPYVGIELIAATAGSTVTLNAVGSPNWSGYYSLNKTSWTAYTLGTRITLTNVGDAVYFKGTQGAAFNIDKHLQFSMTGSINAAGNIMSL